MIKKKNNKSYSGSQRSDQGRRSSKDGWNMTNSSNEDQNEDQDQKK
jgi:hypothetical protein